MTTGKPTFSSLLDDLKAWLEYQLEEGNRTVEMDPELLKNLAHIPRRKADQAAADAGLKSITETIKACTNCALNKTRTNTVPGQGAAHPDIMFIGEAPGADEDQQGLAFVGRAGKLLTKMIEAMGYTRDEVFIGNILKCRPPNNRAPMPEEMETCTPYLKAQIALLKPKVIVALGATSVKGLLNIKTGISKLRGQWHTFEGTNLMPTYHPAYLLRNPSAKKDVWDDLKDVLKHLGRKAPPVRKRTG